MREFLRKIAVSPAVAMRKVGIIYEADRMNSETSNAFLKTLEEPPGRTTLLLLTSRPYALLPDDSQPLPALPFRRVRHTPRPSRSSGVEDDYQSWLGRLADGVSGSEAVAEQILSLYGLVARFNAILGDATTQVWNAQRGNLPPDLDEEEQVAIETGIANGIRQKLFTEIEQATLGLPAPVLHAETGWFAGPWPTRWPNSNAAIPCSRSIWASQRRWRSSAYVVARVVEKINQLQRATHKTLFRW